jgi:hypothetical protein
MRLGPTGRLAVVAATVLATTACSASRDGREAPAASSTSATAATTATSTSSTTASSSTTTVRTPNAHVATATELRDLKEAFLRSHANYREDEVQTSGDFYLATDDDGTQWAGGIFLVPEFGNQDQPEILKRSPGREWEDVGDTGGLVCSIPLSVAAAWHLARIDDTSAGECWAWDPSL